MARDQDVTASSPTDVAKDAGGLVLAVVKDLFFVGRIGETARLAGVPLRFTRTVADLERGLGDAPRFVLVDLTGGFDYEQVFAVLGRAGVPVLAFTTHALARQTGPWHRHADRVVTKETLTRELPSLLRDGVTRTENTGR